MTLDTAALASWIQHRRWYATKNLTIENFELLSRTPLNFAGVEAEHVVVAITTSQGTDLYQLLLASAERDYIETHVQPDSVISSAEQSWYELFGDPRALLGLIDLLNEATTNQALQFKALATLPLATSARVISSEQSNSSVVLGDQLIAKFYRRLTPGLNPDLEIGRALDQRGCQFVPRLRGWAEGELNQTQSTLLVVHEFFGTAVDGFEHALASVRDLIASDSTPAEAGGDFAAESERLGAAVRSIHEDLKAAFGAETIRLDPLIDSMNERLDRACMEVPALRQFEQEIRQRFEVERGRTAEVQRIHGDLHLGQVLRDPTGWKVLDFEGEPGSALEQRRAMSPAVRDVAGMLRSFDYAARQPLNTHPERERLLTHTATWAQRNREAFLRGYGAQSDSLSDVFELDKAVYEALYEHRFRPDWIDVPLGGIARLLESADSWRSDDL